MTYDVLIIGGGVAGLSAAAHLAPHGSVVLLEAETAPGYHTSGRSAAMFEETYGTPSTIELNRASRDHMVKGGYLSPRGFLLVGGADNTAAFDQDLTTMNMAQISRKEAEALVPILNPATTTRFGYHSEAWDIDTDLLMQDYARAARQAGATITTDARVSSISHDTHWRVIAGDKQYEAKTLVNAAGAWADHIAALAGVRPLGITPMRRSVARVGGPDGHDISTWPMLFGPGETWYAKPDAGALIISPADEDPVDPHDAWADDLTLAEGIARYSEVVTAEVTRMLSNWAGLRSFSPDRNLVIGRDNTVPDFCWCAGQGGYGMQSSPGAGRLLSDLIMGRMPAHEPSVIRALDPGRFG